MRKLKPTKKQLLEREEKMIILRESWKNGNYERLNKIEFNYLKKVITEYLKDNGKSAYSSGHEMGFNNSSCNIMFEKFYQFHLIDYVEGTGWFVPKEIGLLFESLPEENSVKSIFGSPKAEELYRILKAKYLFVFPEIPLCAFINKDIIAHLFTESWHEGYFLNCRIDFVITNREGVPYLAYEYQGGYHENEEQIKKDNFKTIILCEVKIPLKHITSGEIKNA